MNSFQKMEAWGNNHHPMWIDTLRMILGLTLHFKGLWFLWKIQMLMQLIQLSFNWQNVLTVALIIAGFHLFFGTLIFIGTATRFSCLLMLPIVIAGTGFVVRYSGFPVTSDVILSAIVLVLLLFFFIEGSGKFSVRYYINKSRRSRQRITLAPKA